MSESKCTQVHEIFIRTTTTKKKKTEKNSLDGVLCLQPRRRRVVSGEF